MQLLYGVVLCMGHFLNVQNYDDPETTFYTDFIQNLLAKLDAVYSLYVEICILYSNAIFSLDNKN